MLTRDVLQSRIRPPARQRGAILAVALVLLLVLTVLGITVVSSSIMEGLMSASYQSQTATLANAENVLRAGERQLEQLTLTGVDEDDLFFVNLEDNPALQFEAADLDVAWPATEYVIEYMGAFEIPGESIAEGGGLADSEIHISRISARSVRPEAERGGLRIVQSLYVTLEDPSE